MANIDVGSKKKKRITLRASLTNGVFGHFRSLRFTCYKWSFVPIRTKCSDIGINGDAMKRHLQDVHGAFPSQTLNGMNRAAEEIGKSYKG